METRTINIYEFHELDDYAKERAIDNFKHKSGYEYSYCWSKEKVINKIYEDNYRFKSNGDFSFL